MKKTLIALAAIAATSASFAQVTISGAVVSGYRQSITNTNTASGTLGGGQTVQQIIASKVTTQNTSSGLGLDDAYVTFTAKEDLGGGQSVSAEMGLVDMYRGGTMTAGDVKLSYTNTAFGRVSLNSTRSAPVMSGYAKAGSPTIDYDAKLFETRSSSEAINFATRVGPVALLVEFGEAGTFPAGVSNGLGVGLTGAAANTRQRSYTYAADYQDGPIKLMGAYKAYDSAVNDSISVPAFLLTKDAAWQVQGSYDFGVANVGLGYTQVRATVGPVLNDWLLGVNVPVGALELGATYASSTVSNVIGTPATSLGGLSAFKAALDTLEGTATGWSVGAKYNLSKRTNLTTNYAAWTRAGYPSLEAFYAASPGTGTGGRDAIAQTGYQAIQTQWNILLSHSF